MSNVFLDTDDLLGDVDSPDYMDALQATPHDTEGNPMERLSFAFVGQMARDSCMAEARDAGPEKEASGPSRRAPSLPAQPPYAERMEDNPSPSPPRSQAESEREPAFRTVPEHFHTFWATAPPTIKSIGVKLSPCTAACMTPLAEHEERMYTRSKCFKMLSPNSEKLLCGPTQSGYHTFLEDCRTELGPHTQSVLFFFSNVLQNITNMANYAVPTTHVNIVTCRKDQKEIVALTTNSVKVDRPRAQAASRARASGYISISKVLQDRALDLPPENKTPVSPIEIYLGFTGVVFKTQGEERRKTFAVTTITNAVNFALWAYIYESFLKKPKKGCPNFAALDSEYREHMYTVQQILGYEMSNNLGINESEFGVPTDYQWNQSGVLGTGTLLNPLMLPFKIFHRIRTEFPDASEIRIIGMPEMTFKEDDVVSNAWVRYMHSHINATQGVLDAVMQSIEQYSKMKDKEQMHPLDTCFSGGWPLHTDDEGTVTCFTLPPMPLMLQFEIGLVRSSCQDTWLTNIGGADGLPEYVKALLRSFLIPSSDLDSFPDISHFLMDSKEITPMRVHEKYFSEDVDPVQNLMVKGRFSSLWGALNTDIKAKRTMGHSIEFVVDMWEQYLVSFPETISSAIRGNMFRSKLIVQMLDICDTMQWEEACCKSESSIQATIKRLSHQMPSRRKHISFARSVKAFWRTWEDANQNLALNSGNLVFVIESMVSQLLYKFGSTNETWVNFFATIMVMSGYGHFLMNSPTGVVPDTRKPNTTGFDFSVARLTDVVVLMYEMVGITERSKMYASPLVTMRWTGTAFENATNATVMSNQVVDQPSDLLNGRALVASEVRGQNMDPVIQALSRGETADFTASLNSGDPDRTNLRKSVMKIRVSDLPLTSMTTNVGISGEHASSLGAVTAILPPGSGPHTKRRRADGCFNSFTPDNSATRHTRIKNKEMVAYMIPFSHTMTSIYAGIPHTLGMITFEIPAPVTEYLEWGFLYLRFHFDGIMDERVRSNFNRMKEGYKSRAVAFSMWVQMLTRMGFGERKDRAIRHMLMTLQVNPLPITTVPMAMCNLMARSVHMSSLLLTSIFAQDFNVPVISWEGLKNFFESDDVPSEGSSLEDYQMIRQFVWECIDRNRFCPQEHAEFHTSDNVSCYITSNGGMTLLPQDTKKALMRFTDSKVPGEDESDYSKKALDRAAHRIQAQYKDVLFRCCHMGPEQSVIRNALDYMLNRFLPDFRNLLGAKKFCSRKHFDKMGFLDNFQGLTDFQETNTPPYIKTCQFIFNGEVASTAIGVNLWSLLAMVSLMGGARIHPHINNDVAKRSVEKVLSNAPVACTPGNSFAVRSFNVEDLKNEELILSKHNRPEHFLRPYDHGFAQSGVLPVGKVVDQYLPEDLMHAPSLERLSKFLHCTILEVPARAVMAEYELVPDRHYAMHVPLSHGRRYGTVIVISTQEIVEITEFDDDVPCEGNAVQFSEWFDFIRARSYVLTPMIWRGGACVRISTENGAVPGCIIPFEGSQNQFNHEKCQYKVLVDSDLSTVDVFFLDVLSSLVPVGEPMHLKMDVLPRPHTQAGKWIMCRLAVPNMPFPQPGKLYVQCVHKPRRVGNETAGADVMLFCVNPWDLRLASQFEGNPKEIVEKLT